MNTARSWALSGRSVLLTGAAGTVGRSAARALREAGAEILGVDRNKEPLEEMAGRGELADVLAGDLTDAEFTGQVSERWPEVDILVNNVGAGTSLTLADTSDETVDEMLDINLRVAIRLCRHYAPAMARRRHGKVINVSSVLALHPVPTVAAYAAAKAALVGFTRSIALEYATRGVQCNVLAPGYLQGPKNADYFSSPTGQEFSRRFMPGGEPGPETALDGPLLFLASAMSDHVTGQVLIVDGGYSVW